MVIAGVRSPAISKATRIGPLPGTQVLRLQVVLHLRNLAALRARVAGLSNPDSRFFQAFLTPAQITARYGPTRQQLALVEGFLRGQGFTIGSASPQRNFVAVSAPVGTVERAFAVAISRYRERATGRVFYASDRDPAFPAAVAPLVLAVIGLDNYARPQPLTGSCTSPRNGPPQGPCAAPKGMNSIGTNDYGFTPDQLREGYTVNWLTHSGLCATCDGGGQNIGVLELSGWSQTYEQTFDQAYGLAPPATIPDCTDSPGCSPLPPSGDIAEVEADSDVQVVHAIAPEAQVVVYESANPDFPSALLSELAGVMCAGAAPSTACPHPPAGVPTTSVNSISLGTCEQAFDPATLTAIDDEFTALAGSDHTFFVASGDSGKYCDVPGGTQGVDFPASDPNVTAVGGTNLFLNTNNDYVFEYAWSHSGGGASTFFARPSWQQGPGVPAGTTRLVPDVSADAYAGGASNTVDWADPSLPSGGRVGYSVYTVTHAVGNSDLCTDLSESDPCWQAEGGTSLASPLWASVAAIYNEYATTRKGAIPLDANVNAQLYNLAFKDHRYDGAITDITWNPRDRSLLASPAGPGWDASTGVGTPRMKSMAQDLPTLKLQPIYGPPKTNIALRGAGFLPGEPIVAKDVSAQITLCETTATNDGDFSCSATIPAKAPCGTLDVAAVGRTSREATLRTFNVQCGGGWTIQPTPNPSGARTSGLNGVSCTSSSACTAVGYSDGRTLAERWDGGAWSIQTTPTPAGSNGLSSVSCSSQRACTAVGGGSTITFAERWDGTKWSTEHAPSANLQGVSCVSAADCTAVGYYLNDGTEMTRAEHWNGTKWSIQPTPNPGGAANELNAVSCVSASNCTAVGSSNGGGELDYTLAEHWNGTKWSIQPTPNPTGSMSNDLRGVSCASAGDCTAVGSYLDTNTGDFVTLAEHWDGSTWTIEATPNPAGNQESYLAAVSCASATACTAIGNQLIGGSTWVTLAESWDGTTWSIEPTPPNPAGDTQDIYLFGVSCPSAKDCAAAGRFFTSAPASNTLAERRTR